MLPDIFIGDSLNFIIDNLPNGMKRVNTFIGPSVSSTVLKNIRPLNNLMADLLSITWKYF